MHRLEYWYLLTLICLKFFHFCLNFQLQVIYQQQHGLFKHRHHFRQFFNYSNFLIKYLNPFRVKPKLLISVLLLHLFAFILQPIFADLIQPIIQPIFVLLLAIIQLIFIIHRLIVIIQHFLHLLYFIFFLLHLIQVF